MTTWDTWHPLRGSYNDVVQAHLFHLYYLVDVRLFILRSILQIWLAFLQLVIVRNFLTQIHAQPWVNDPLMYSSLATLMYSSLATLMYSSLATLMYSSLATGIVGAN
jgi:hypothetical protein